METEKRCKGAKTHGLSYTRLYRIWHSMYCRCYYPTTNGYSRYGGRGIKVCEEWSTDFLSFYNWAINNGYAENLTLDRIDVNGNYEPKNCKWSTVKEQSRNRRTNRLITFRDETKTQVEWCNIFNVSATTFNDRIKRGWTVEQALTKPVTKCGGFLYYTLNNETKLLSEWCKIYKINYQTAWKKAKKGYDIERILKLDKQ